MKKLLSALLALTLVLGMFAVAGAEETAAAAEEHVAYLMMAESSWTKSYFYDGQEHAGVTAKNVEVAGPGSYTVGLEFDGEAAGLAFAAVGLTGYEQVNPRLTIEVTAIRVNGEPIEFTKGYTMTDDNPANTRINLYNEWIDKMPASARSFDGSLEGASSKMVDPAAFAAVTSVEVDFNVAFATDVAYLMMADASWSHSFWYDGNEYPVTATTAEITGPGTYKVGIEFNEAAEGLAFAGVGIANGENTFPGFFIDVTEVKVNGEAIALTGKGYTTSDDGITTRENLYNEWVSDLPAEARRADGDLEGASPKIVDPAVFTGVMSVEVTFDFIYGAAPEKVDAAAPLTEEEAAALCAADYNAYIGVQTTSYIFRNQWNETNYGRDAEGGYFGHLTGWDADNKAVNYGGSFVDTAMTTAGTYSVALTTGEMGFGEDTAYRMLFVSTDIPSKLVAEGYVTIKDVKVVIGERSIDITNLDTEGDYVQINVFNEYVSGVEWPAIPMIGANETITITFTVEGLTD